MTSPNFKLQPIQTVSPSLVEILRTCPLQAALSRIYELRQFVLGNPKAWLGIAYHGVLERLWMPVGESLTGEQLVERLWLTAIDTLRQRALAHPLDHRFSMPEKWPGFYLVRACLGIRAREVINDQPRVGGSRTPSDGIVTHARETKLTAMGGKLSGKPDVITSDEIWDYKSGSVYDETPEGVKTVKQGYVRQLLLYGHLVHENYGKCPAKGKLLPMQGGTVEIDLDSETCANEAGEAVRLLDSFNASLTASSDVTEIATPSPSACRWCNFKLLCPAFWREVNDGWVKELGSAAVRGSLKGTPAAIHNARAFSVPIDVSAGTTAAIEMTIAPFDKQVYPYLSELRIEEEVRIINLFPRRDGQLAPTSATVCSRSSDCPEFSLGGLEEGDR